ncbi:MAG: TIM barrel protein [Steroidobacteraceae bacterium]
MLSRRQFTSLACSSAALSFLPAASVFAARMNSTVRGVKLGLITGSLNPLPELPGRDPIDVIIDECRQVGAANIELVSVFGATPPEVVNGGRFGQVPDTITPEYTASREVLRQWRIAQPLDRFREVRRKFKDAGLNLFSYVWTVSDDYTDAEIDACFRQMKALGVKIFCTNQTRVGMGPKIAPFAEKHGISPAWHPHANVQDPNEVATPESMEKLLAMSRSFMINLDIGHFTAGNNDAVAFLRKHHRRITHLHVKDRKRDQGPNVQLGTGDTPIAECLRLIRDNRWPIYAIIEREYRGPGTPVDETRGQMQYMQQILTG